MPQQGTFPSLKGAPLKLSTSWRNISESSGPLSEVSASGCAGVCLGVSLETGRWGSVPKAGSPNRSALGSHCFQWGQELMIQQTGGTKGIGDRRWGGSYETGLMAEGAEKKKKRVPLKGKYWKRVPASSPRKKKALSSREGRSEGPVVRGSTWCLPVTSTSMQSSLP